MGGYPADAQPAFGRHHDRREWLCDRGTAGSWSRDGTCPYRAGRCPATHAANIVSLT